ncbi:hypothetical protein ND748_17525 [Frankia sp. AiPs1]|nr:hypothetical protein [Frankia sp. AiPs1]MCM3923454.1 hypothetical protein [Frankia sp. AiPs1]
MALTAWSGRQEKNSRAGQVGIGGDHPGGGAPVQFGHRAVHHRHPGTVVANRADRRRAVGGVRDQA